jgi:hypothetical protein
MGPVVILLSFPPSSLVPPFSYVQWRYGRERPGMPAPRQRPGSGRGCPRHARVGGEGATSLLICAAPDEKRGPLLQLVRPAAAARLDRAGRGRSGGASKSRRREKGGRVVGRRRELQARREGGRSWWRRRETSRARPSQCGGSARAAGGEPVTRALREGVVRLGVACREGGRGAGRHRERVPVGVEGGRRGAGAARARRGSEVRSVAALRGRTRGRSAHGEERRKQIEPVFLCNKWHWWVNNSELYEKSQNMDFGSTS